MSYKAFLESALLTGLVGPAMIVMMLWMSGLMRFVWPWSIVALVVGILITEVAVWVTFWTVVRIQVLRMRIRMARDAFEVQLLWEQSQSLYAPLRRIEPNERKLN
jgi:hypothetical protein